MTRPIIGLTLDREEEGEFATTPWYALRENYCSAVFDAGGNPITFPHEPDLCSEYLTLIDGLIITGGNFDVDPTIFGAKSKHSLVKLKEKRTAFEIEIMRQAIDQDIPTLGICGGEQLLNVIFGGSLIQHIPDEIENPLDHEQTNPKSEPAHDIFIKENTLLHQIVKKRKIAVNSSHHQAVAAPGNTVVSNAFAPDGVIEGIEVPSKRFCLGVQWHPEYGINKSDQAIFQGFVDATK